MQIDFSDACCILILQSSGTLSLDLLTYGDLESLHNLNSTKAERTTKYAPGTKATSHLHAKRYLIMTYTVEFDRYGQLGCILVVPSFIYVYYGTFVRVLTQK